MIDYMEMVRADGKNVIVTDIYGNKKSGYCHCYAEPEEETELQDDNFEIVVYIIIGSTKFDQEDIESIEIIDS